MKIKMKAFTYVGLTIIMLITIILSIRTFYYCKDVSPILFILLTILIFIFCIAKAIEEVRKL